MVINIYLLFNKHKHYLCKTEIYMQSVNISLIKRMNKWQFLFKKNKVWFSVIELFYSYFIKINLTLSPLAKQK